MTRAVARTVAVLLFLVVTAPFAHAQTTCTPPVITTHPADQAILAGGSATLSATATGTAPLSYQWFRNVDGIWLSVSGATSATVTVKPAVTTAYRVRVVNACGNATSRSATVTVCQTPTITSHPASTTVETGGRVTLSVTAQGSDLTYQWYRGTTGNTSDPLIGATASSLTVAGITTSRSYWVRVSNECGYVNSQTARITVTGACVSPEITQEPASVSIASGQTATLSVAASGSAPAYQWYAGQSGDASNPISGAIAAQYTTPALTSTTAYWVRVSNSCGSDNSVTAIVTVGGAGCTPPTIVTGPQNVSVAPGSTATLSVAAAGTSPLQYQWYKGSSGDTSAPFAGATSSSFTTPPIATTTSIWVRVSNACGEANSAAATITVTCAQPPAPDTEAPAQVISGTTYAVAWAPLPAAARYEVEEADNPAFAGAIATSTATPSMTFKHTVVAPTRFYYRVRGVGNCEAGGGPYSVVENVAVVLAPAATELQPNATVPVGSIEPVMFQYLLMPPAGKGALDTTFSATTDKPWMTASPASGTIPPGGTTITVAANPESLPTGTSTGTLKVTGPSGSVLANVPLSVTVVTPVTTLPKGSPQNDALVLPVVGHAQGGLSSLFLSDVRITNASNHDVEYLLVYSPTRTSGTESKQARIVLHAQETKALNDVVRNWFGFGSIGESALGVLEVRPLNAGAATVASSRTYNTTPDGTFGQFIPAIPYAQFIGKSPTAKISLQQIAQSSAYRTNFGIVEGSGQPATARVRVYNAFGQKRGETTISLLPFEHQQWNRLLETLSVPDLADGRIEVEVTSDTGRVTAYASVVDNKTNDPLLVFPAVPNDVRTRRYVLPGVADLDTGQASWRTDVRIFNGGTASASAVMTFQESRRTNGTLPAPVSRPVTIQPGDIVVYDSVLESHFGVSNVGGLIYITTPTDSSLVVTARTYDQRPAGTYGQFIPAVSGDESVGVGDRTLEVLQVEESARFRTNLGIAETSGNPVVVEIYAL
ncbi:MAG: Ig-like domain-containing protein, partial [Thermoanaerobaculia bacterium]